jgi:hypothetical protein
MHCTLFLLLFHFTLTCFDVWNIIFRECTKSFLHTEPTSKCKKKFGALPADDVPYIETGQSEVKKQ